MKRETYSKEQLLEYFEHIRLPDPHRLLDVSSLSPEAALVHLTVLQKYQLCAVPFENLVLHYSLAHQNNLHPQALFRKIVQSGGSRRGGYCMENNGFFGTVLRSLGYTLYSAGGRVHQGPSGYGGWNHMVNLVTIGGKKYLVDVGYGPNGPAYPKALEHDVVTEHLAPASVRYELKNINENVDPGQRLWVYEHRINDEADWVDLYCFTELEFIPSDYNMINYYTSTSRHLFFTHKVIVTRSLLDAHGEYEGVLIMSDTLKKRVHGKSQHLEDLNTEEQRIAALDKYFGIVLSDEEKHAIGGMASELGAPLFL